MTIPSESGRYPFKHGVTQAVFTFLRPSYFVDMKKCFVLTNLETLQIRMSLDTNSSDKTIKSSRGGRSLATCAQTWPSWGRLYLSL